MKRNLLILFAFVLYTTSSIKAQTQNALDFDGTDDYVQTNITSITGAQNRTIEAWIKTGTVTTQKVIVGMGTMPLGTRFTLNVLNSKLRIEIGGGGINSATNVDDNVWHHVAVTYDDKATTKFKLYIDGVLDASGNITAATVNTAAGTGVAIGRRNDGVNYFNGTIDEVRIWNVERSAAQILNSMNNELCSSSGLVGYYKLNQGIASGMNTSITTANDNTSNGNNGTLNGFALSGASSNWVTGVTLTSGTNTTSSFAVTSCGVYTSPSGNVYLTSQTLTDIIPNSAGCDSIMTINLTVAGNTSSTMSAFDCSSYTAPNGMTYTSSQVISYTIPNAAGCDSTITINLTIGNNSSSQTVNTCGSYTSPSGTVYNSSQIITDVIPNAAGCDSTITIDLTVNTPSSSTTAVTACGSYASPSGMIYTSSQTIMDTIPNVGGCDSVMTINLTIETVDVNVVIGATSLTATATNSTFQWIDCDTNLPISNETNATFTPVDTGNYAVIVTTPSGCENTSPCVAFSPTTSTNKLNLNTSINYYPNPTTGLFSVNLGEVYSNVSISITSIDGKEVLNEQFNHTELVNLELNQPAGVYFVKLTTETGQAVLKVIKH